MAVIKAGVLLVASNNFGDRFAAGNTFGGLGKKAVPNLGRHNRKVLRVVVLFVGTKIQTKI